MSSAMLSAYVRLSEPYLALGALLIALVAVLYCLSLHRRLRKLMMGRNGSIEETLGVLSRESKEHKQFRAELERYLKLAEARLRGSIQGLGIVRFNPFQGQGQGGDQSFAAAFLDEEGRGVVLSSLYARSQLGFYAKPLEKWASTYELSDEERQAVAEARQRVAARKKE
jgi:hypothetical protein